MGKISYNHKILSQSYYDLCCQGKSLTQIAHRLGVTTKQLKRWAVDPRKYTWIAIWDKGREACQSYHEDLFDRMIKGDIKAASKEIDAQQYRLKTWFKDDWDIKSESKLTITNMDSVEQLTKEQLINLITRKLNNSELKRQLNGQEESILESGQQDCQDGQISLDGEGRKTEQG